MSISKCIAKAIRKADKRYFFENYDKQASAVINSLKKEGYCIMPYEPDMDLLREVADSISTGKMRPEDHIRNVYQTVAKKVQKKYAE
jgi:hypothetical protein